MGFVVAAALYYFLVHLFLPEVLQFPQRLAIPRLSAKGLFGRRITKTSGGILTALFWIVGLAIWFGLCLAPVMLLRDQLYPVAPVTLWCFGPIILGMVTRRLASARRAA
jgi:hypothetical protein